MPGSVRTGCARRAETPSFENALATPAAAEKGWTMSEHKNIRSTMALASSPSMLLPDPADPLPLYVQVERLVREMIKQPKYQRGELLPDEISLSRGWGVSRSTVRAAMSTLVTEGVLQRQSGVGTRVRRDRLVSGVAAWHSFTKEMARRGITVQRLQKTCTQVGATGEVAGALGLAARTPVILIEQIRGWDDIPSAVFDSYLHPRLGLTTGDNYTRPLYELIGERSGILPERSIEEFTAIAADKVLARKLDVQRGTPLLARKRIVLDTAGKPMEFARVFYRSDRFTLTLTLEKERS
jgi:GntR family transcriptional regulator